MNQEETIAPRPGRFTLDVIRTHESTRHIGIPGWSDGDLWNGWETPRFERDAAELLASTLRAIGLELRYELATDAYISPPEGFDESDPDAAPEVFEVYGGRDMVVSDGRTLHLYPVGTRNWCWEDAGTAHRP